MGDNIAILSMFWGLGTEALKQGTGGKASRSAVPIDSCSKIPQEHLIRSVPALSGSKMCLLGPFLLLWHPLLE